MEHEQSQNIHPAYREVLGSSLPKSAAIFRRIVKRGKRGEDLVLKFHTYIPLHIDARAMESSLRVSFAKGSP